MYPAQPARGVWHDGAIDVVRMQLWVDRIFYNLKLKWRNVNSVHRTLFSTEPAAISSSP